MMNKTEQVSIGRKGFVCDLDAHKELESYLSRCKKALHNDPDADEIMADLEASMAGHLEELSGPLVVDRATALRVISMMGEIHSEQIDVNEKEFDKTEASFGDRLRTMFKGPLYKDHAHQIGDGVCAGIAKTLEVDPLWIRLGFVVLAFLSQGFMVLVYIVLAIIMKDEEGYTKRTAGEVVQNVREKIVDGVKVKTYENVLSRVFVAFVTALWWICKSVALLALFALIGVIGVAWAYLLFSAVGHTELAGDLLGQITWIKTLAIGLMGVVLLLPLIHVTALLISPKKIVANTRLAVLLWVTWFIALFAGLGAAANVAPEVINRWREAPVRTRYVDIRVADGEIRKMCVDIFGGCQDDSYYMVQGFPSSCFSYRQYSKGQTGYWLTRGTFEKSGTIEIPYPGDQEALCDKIADLEAQFGADNYAVADDYPNETVRDVVIEQDGKNVMKRFWQIEYVYNEKKATDAGVMPSGN